MVLCPVTDHRTAASEDPKQRQLVLLPEPNPWVCSFSPLFLFCANAPGLFCLPHVLNWEGACHDSPTEIGGCHSPGQRSIALCGCSSGPLTVTVQSEDSPWDHFLPLLSSPGCHLSPSLQTQLALWQLGHFSVTFPPRSGPCWTSPWTVTPCLSFLGPGICRESLRPDGCSSEGHWNGATELEGRQSPGQGGPPRVGGGSGQLGLWELSTGSASLGHFCQESVQPHVPCECPA